MAQSLDLLKQFKKQHCLNPTRRRPNRTYFFLNIFDCLLKLPQSHLQPSSCTLHAFDGGDVHPYSIADACAARDGHQRAPNSVVELQLAHGCRLLPCSGQKHASELFDAFPLWFLERRGLTGKLNGLLWKCGSELSPILPRPHHAARTGCGL